MAGYSHTALVSKLGIKPSFKILIRDEPIDYWNWISPLPEGVLRLNKAQNEGIDFIHLFVTSNKIFEVEFLKLKIALKKQGLLWVSWPKKSAKVETDLDENKIRNFGLANGLVDVKVCAVNEIWSGLKFVYRTKDR
ncbi:MAG: DUF3052 domain-containing protein [Flammeovirgaceae bacterium]|jgi:hypothetical protein|nr:DUF3052 domain-containing protein [Flammeovirgaceae bacterium]